MPQKTIKTGRLFRSARLDRAAANADHRTVELSFSSEEPYDRWFGREILDHGSKSVRLGRLQDAGPLLLDHDTRRHIGVIESVDIGSDRVGRALVRFGKGPEAEVAFQDVLDGIRSHVSVGYIVHRMTLEEEAKDGPNTYRVDDWEPLEVSLVAVPADPTVGVGRAETRDEVDTVVVVAERSRAETPPAEPQIIITQTQESREMSEENPQPAQNNRAARIAAIGAQYAKYVSAQDVADAITGERSVEEFQDAVMKRIEARHSSVDELKIGLSKKEAQRYSLCRAVNAQLTGKWDGAGFERECSTAAEKVFGRSAEGFMLPFEAFETLVPARRDFTAGTAGEAGNLIDTDLRGDLFTDALRNALVLGRLGSLVLTGLSSNLDLPRKSVAGTVGMVTEIATASETQPTTVKVTLSPKRMSAFVQVSKQAIIQGSMGIEQMIRQDLLDGTAVLFENQAINGSGSSPNIRGIRNVAGIGSVVGGTNGANLAWTHIVGLESACANSNAEPDQVAGYLINTKARGTAKQTQKATNLPFIWDNGAAPLNGYRAGVTNNVPSNLTKGASSGVCSSVLFSSDWRMLVLAIFGGLDITVDPYTQKNSGMVEIAVNAYGDVGCRQPAAFAAMDDALTP